MILPEKLISVGNVIKTHGINGEISAILDPEVDPDSIRCIVFILDGIPVPFFIEHWRTRGSEAVLLTLEDIDSEQKAKELTGKDIYVFKDNLPDKCDDEGFFVADLIGWDLVTSGEKIGKIIDFDDSTINILLIVESYGGKNIYIPVAEEFITKIDHHNRIIEMNLPEGILEL